MRVILISDVHFCRDDIEDKERFYALVSDINKVHENEPLDSVFMLGDYALDHWINGGAYLKEGINYAERFIKNIIPLLPCKAYFIPGNHEQYGESTWLNMAGTARQHSVVVDDCVFVLLDNFAEDLDPSVDADGTYSYSDVNYIQSQLNKYPEKSFFLCAHDFRCNEETNAFKELVRTEERILALFCGHSHTKESICLGAGYGNKYLHRTGHYSYGMTGCRNDQVHGYRILNVDGDQFKTDYMIMH